MPMISAQNWNSSVYVIMGTPPFRRGKDRHAPPKKDGGANRLPFTTAPYAGIIAHLLVLVHK